MPANALRDRPADVLCPSHLGEARPDSSQAWTLRGREAIFDTPDR